MVSEEVMLSTHDVQQSMCPANACAPEMGTESKPLKPYLDYWKDLDLARRTSLCLATLYGLAFYVHDRRPPARSNASFKGTDFLDGL